MLANKLQIYVDTQRVIDDVLGYTKNVSREVKFVEWTEIRHLLWRSLDVVYLANRDVNLRTKYLEDYLCYMQGVRSRVRMLCEHRYIGIRFATHIVSAVDGCMKQATAWRNYAAKGQSRSGMPNREDCIG